MEQKTDQRLAKAGENLRRIERKIGPFTKKSPLRRQTTAGKWRETRSVVKQHGVVKDPRQDS